jgi:hypothetical protein
MISESEIRRNLRRSLTKDPCPDANLNARWGDRFWHRVSRFWTGSSIGVVTRGAAFPSRASRRVSCAKAHSRRNRTPANRQDYRRFERHGECHLARHQGTDAAHARDRLRHSCDTECKGTYKRRSKKPGKGWWARQDSNLRQHRMSGLPVATRGCPRKHPGDESALAVAFSCVSSVPVVSRRFRW